MTRAGKLMQALSAHITTKSLFAKKIDIFLSVKIACFGGFFNNCNLMFTKE